MKAEENEQLGLLVNDLEMLVKEVNNTKLRFKFIDLVERFDEVLL